MRICPNCRLENEETATICEQCNQALPPPAMQEYPPMIPSVPEMPFQLLTAQRQDGRRKTLQFFLGMGLGLIPLIVYFPGLARSLPPMAGDVWWAVLLFTSLALYLAAIIATKVLFSIQKVRFVGYGLLTLVLISPVVAFISCIVSITNTNR